MFDSQNDDGAFQCTCAEGFKGRHCEYTAGTCLENPCENGGTCQRLYDGASYECVCEAGYTGDNCEEELNECDSNPCVNGNCPFSSKLPLFIVQNMFEL